MKKVLSIVTIAAFSAVVVACGPSKEEIEAREKAKQDSIEAVEKAKQDSIAAVEAENAIEKEILKQDLISYCEKDVEAVIALFDYMKSCIK